MSVRVARRVLTLAGEVFGRRVVRLRALWLPILQSACGSALAWWFANDVLRHSRPFFAPVAAVISVGVASGRRLRRVLQIVVGVSVGVGVGDLLVSVLGAGAWQLALIVALAMVVAVLLDGGSLITLQAGSSAVLVATLLPPSGGGGTERLLDALIGGLIGLAAIAILPGSPPGMAERHGRLMFDELAAALTGAADAITHRDADRATAALERARGGQRRVDQYRDALETAREITALSPLRRRQRHRIERYCTAATPVDHALHNARVMLRRLARAIRDGETIPPLLTAMEHELAKAAHSLARELILDRDPVSTREKLLRIKADLNTDDLMQGGFSSQVVGAQLQSITIDLLQATGAED